jgi:hypothetical protein
MLHLHGQPVLAIYRAGIPPTALLPLPSLAPPPSPPLPAYWTDLVLPALLQPQPWCAAAGLPACACLTQPSYVLLPLPCVAGCAAAAADAVATATAAAVMGAVAGPIGCGPSPASPVFCFFLFCRCCFSRAASVSAGSACRCFVKQASQSSTAARRPSVSRSRSTQHCPTRCAPSLLIHPAV